MRLIDADALPLGKFPKVRTEWHRGWNDALDAVCEAAPTIEAKPVKHGRRERYSDDKFMGYDTNGKLKYRKIYTYECDCCRNGTAVKTNYCPNCGCKMDLEVDNG